jgi:hypothetical protein
VVPLKGRFEMTLKRVSKIAIVCLSLSALLHVTRDIWLHRLIVLGVFEDTRTLLRVANAFEVLLFHVPLIFFFVVLYRLQKTEGLR